MRITGSDVALSANSQRYQYEQAVTQVRVWQERRQQQPQPSSGAEWRPRDGEPPPDTEKVKQEEQLFEQRRQLWANDPLLARYISLLERMFGVRVAILDPADLQANGPAEVLAAGAENLTPAPTRPQLAITVDHSHTRYEAEEVQFQASGQVTTADGRTINLQIASNISREFLEHSETQFGTARPSRCRIRAC